MHLDTHITLYAAAVFLGSAALLAIVVRLSLAGYIMVGTLLLDRIGAKDQAS